MPRELSKGGSDYAQSYAEESVARQMLSLLAFDPPKDDSASNGSSPVAPGDQSPNGKKDVSSDVLPGVIKQKEVPAVQNAPIAPGDRTPSKSNESGISSGFLEFLRTVEKIDEYLLGIKKETNNDGSQTYRAGNTLLKVDANGNTSFRVDANGNNDDLRVDENGNVHLKEVIIHSHGSQGSGGGVGHGGGGGGGRGGRGADHNEKASLLPPG